MTTAYGPRAASPSRFAFIDEETLPFAAAALGVGLAALLGVALVAVAGGDDRAARVRRRLSIYTLTGRQPVKTAERSMLGDSAVARGAVERAGRVVRQRDLETVLERRLEAAAVPLKPAEWLLVHVGFALLGGLVLLLLTGGRLVPALLGVAIFAVLPWTYLSIKESRRRSAFLGQLPETLQLMAGSLAAGYSLAQAVDTVVQEGTGPVTSELNRALVEARLGVPIEDALAAVATRMDSRDFSWVVMAIRIQRQVGGNLAELLTTVAATLRERERLRRQVKALSAEGRLSGWILGLLPPAFAAYLLVAQPQYLEPLFTDPLGWALVFVAVVLLLSGAFWMRRLVRVEV
jgi:tight adherence protein B